MGFYLEGCDGLLPDQILKKFGKSIDWNYLLDHLLYDLKNKDSFNNFYDIQSGDLVNQFCPIFILDNGSFKAYGIAFNHSEFVRFVRGINGRNVQYFICNVDIIKKQYPDLFNKELIQ